MFKIFCTDEAALHKFIEGTEVSKPIMDEVLDSYSIYDLTKVKQKTEATHTDYSLLDLVTKLLVTRRKNGWNRSKKF